MNDGFLYRLRQPPPATFAARLRARLESQALARRFRRRQITLYSLIACLLGSTALAWVVPGVRQVTSTVLGEMLPDSVRERLAMRAPSPPPGVPASQRAASEPVRAAPPPAASSKPATRTMVGIFAPAPAQPAQVAASRALVVSGTRQAAMTEPSRVKQVRLIGATQTAAALSSAIGEFQDLYRDLRIVLASTTNTKAFSRFCSGEGEAALATRMMTQGELETCRRSVGDVTVIPIAYEALAVVVHSLNNWADSLPRDALARLFDRRVQSSTLMWSRLDARWPAAVVEAFLPRAGSKFADTFNELVLDVTYAEGFGSGTVVGDEEMLLLQRVSSRVHGLTFLPYPTYLEFTQRFPVRLIDIVDSNGVRVAPSRASIANGSYELARPLLLFVRRQEDAAGLNGFIQRVLSTAERRLERSEFLALSRAETKLALNVLLTRGRETGVAPFDASPLSTRSAQAILLQQLPPERREQARLELESN